MNSAQCIEHVTRMMDSALVTFGDVRPAITRLFEEGIAGEAIINLLIERQHKKHEQMILGRLPKDHLDMFDIRYVETALGVNEKTPENKQHWSEKFESGRARYICPQCGYAGNEEFRSLPDFGTPMLACYACDFWDDPRYFTRKWTADEQQSFEKVRAKKTALKVKREELERRQAEFVAALRTEAVKAVKEIDAHQWDMMGEDYEYVTEEAEPRVLLVMAIMARSVPPMPYDEVVAYFKEHLKPKDNYDGTVTEFARVACNYDKMATKLEEAL